MSDRARLTTDNPTSNVMNMLNLAYIKNNKVYLRYAADDGEDTDLCVLCSDLAAKQGCDLTPNEIMEGACLECECEVNIVYHLAAQAAELRERLKYYEDLEEQGRLIVPLVEIGQTIYTKYGFSFKVEKIEILKDGNKIYRCGNDGTDDYMAFYEKEIGEDIFLYRKEAERALLPENDIDLLTNLNDRM